MLSSRALLLTRRVKACFCRWVDHFQNIAFSCTATNSYIPLSHKAMLSTSKCASFPQYSCRGTRIFLAIMWLHQKTLVVGWKARSNFSFHEPMLYQFPFKVNHVDLCSPLIGDRCRLLPLPNFIYCLGWACTPIYTTQPRNQLDLHCVTVHVEKCASDRA